MITGDWLGAGLSLAATLSLTQARRYAWALSLIAIVCNFMLYYQTHLISQMLIELYYGATTLYGWYHQKGCHQTRRFYIQSLSRLEIIQAIGIILLGISLATQTLSLLESAVLICAISAQWLTMHRILQAWPLWIVADILIVILDYNAQLPFHTGLHIVYLGIALIGYKKWNHLFRSQTTETEYTNLNTNPSSVGSNLSVGFKIPHTILSPP